MRIAVAQTPGTRLAEWRTTRTLLEGLVGRAADQGAELVVLPECAWPAYCLGSKQAYRDARAAGLPGPDEFLSRMCQTARRRHIAVCAGFVAEEEDRLLNAAALIDGGGHLLGTRHKCFLWSFDRDYFEAGARLAPIATPLGLVGVMICADARLPEIPATLAAHGAELILHPTAWVNAGSADAPWNPQPDFLIQARAAELGVPVASASKWGVEGHTTFVGSSLICEDDRVLAAAGPAETTVIVADVRPRKPHPSQLTEAEECILLTRQPPTLPRTDVAPLELLPLPPGGAIALARPMGSGLWQTVPRSGMPDVGGVRVGVLSAAHARSFAPARCLALGGAHVLLVHGDIPFVFPRARACENQVFVVAIDSNGWCAIDPRGLVLRAVRWGVGPDQGILLDAAQAASKTVAPQTDVIAGRRPGQYAFRGC